MNTELLTIPEAAERLKCSKGSVYRLISLGQLRAVDLSVTGTRSKSRVRSDDVQALIEERTRSAS